MRRPRSHTVFEGSTVHKIWRAHNREYLLGSDDDKLSYLSLLKDDYVEHGLRDKFEIYGYVVMDNHVHELIHIKEEPAAFSDHMRRSHGRFGLLYNRKHGRLGKVASDRPKTLRVQDTAVERVVLFYMFANLIRAGKCKDAGNIRYRLISAYRYYAYGEENEYTVMLSYPRWYMELGRSAKLRQRKFRSLFDRYIRDRGLVAEACYSKGFLIGDETWKKSERSRYRGWWKADWQGPDPPE